MKKSFRPRRNTPLKFGKQENFMTYFFDNVTQSINWTQ